MNGCSFHQVLRGVSEFLDSGRKSWTLGSGRWTLDAGLWTMDYGLWTLNAGLWALDAERWILDSGHWSLDVSLITQTAIQEHLGTEYEYEHTYFLHIY